MLPPINKDNSINPYKVDKSVITTILLLLLLSLLLLLLTKTNPEKTYPINIIKQDPVNKDFNRTGIQKNR
jgi:hypothetical protein